jgi:hypothetical protein
MIINQISNILPLDKTQSILDALKNISLTPNQRLTATVLDSNASTNTVLLNIQGALLKAETTLPLTPNQQVILEVKTVSPQLVLSMANEDSTHQLPKELILLSNTLPKQLDGNPLFSLLANIDKSSSALLKSLIEPLKLSSYPIETLPQTLKTALAQSGYFYENQLANQPNYPYHKDFKGAILKLLQQLNNYFPNQPSNQTPIFHKSPHPMQYPPIPLVINPIHLDDINLPELLKSTAEGVLHRITATQLLHLTEASIIPYQMQIDIPIRIHQKEEVIPFFIKQQPSSSPISEETTFQMAFAITPAKLGSLQGEVILKGTRLSIILHAESTDTYQLLTDKKNEFESIFVHLGLVVDGIHIDNELKMEEVSLPNYHLVDITI